MSNKNNYPRKEVILFGALMEEVLKANDYKGGWTACDVNDLYLHFVDEVSEVKELVVNADSIQSMDVVTKDKFIRELLDTANMAMMVVEQLGGIKFPKDEVFTGGKVQFAPESIQHHLDGLIRFWREEKVKALIKNRYVNAETATQYIDAFQAVREAIFGEVLSQEMDKCSIDVEGDG